MIKIASEENELVKQKTRCKIIIPWIDTRTFFTTGITQKIFCISKYYHASIKNILQMQDKAGQQNLKKILMLEANANIKKNE